MYLSRLPPDVLAVLFPSLVLLALASGGDRTLDDRDLARRIRNGDRDAFRALFERHHGLLYAFLRRRGLSHDHCEDLIQQAFVMIWERRDQIDDEKSLRAFLFRICYTRALNHFRDTAKFASDDQLLDIADAPQSEGGAEFVLMQERLMQVVRELPERRRAVFELCFIKEMTYREAAEALDISVKTVEHHMSAALKTLRSAFKHYVEESDR